MKKQLVGTTALVGVAALAASGVAQDANAADPLSLTIGGYYQTALEAWDQDDSGGEAAANTQSFRVLDDGELQFTASTTLDNGIGVKVRMEYEHQNQGDGQSNADEHWVQFSGGFGALKIGSDDNASNVMQYQAPVAAAVMGVNTPTFALVAHGSNRASTTTFINTGGDAQKIIWFSPRIAGFQLGLSYAPDSSANDSGTFQRDDDNGAQEDVISVGLNYVETFNDIDVAIAGGYLRGELEDNTTGFTFTTATGAATVTSGGAAVGTGATTTGTNGDDMESWSAGLNVGFAGFTVGASVALSNNGLDSNGDSTTWDAGVTYSTGPLTVGFAYLQSTAEDPVTGGDDELNMGAFTGNYNIGPGVDLWGGVKFFEYEDDDNADAAENQGYVAVIGSSVSF